MDLELRQGGIPRVSPRAVAMRIARQFMPEKAGQDLIEYSLLLGAVALAGLALTAGTGSATESLWSILNSRIAGS
jgi:Flp pilus assembly pilin Flp